MKLSKEQIYRIRKFYGLTMAEFGELVGVTAQAVHRIENGLMRISSELNASVIKAFEMTPNKLRSITLHYRKNVLPFGDKNRKNGAGTK